MAVICKTSSCSPGPRSKKVWWDSRTSGSSRQNRTANNLPGIRGTEPGDWAAGTPTVDIRTNPNGGTIPDWFERYPWRRSLIVLERQTGKEVAFDLDNDGTRMPPPMLWAWTHGGTCYPPLVSGYDDVIYFRSVSHATGPSIPERCWSAGSMARVS